MRHPARLLLTGAALLVATACNNESSVAPHRGAPPTVAGSPALAALATSASVDFVIPAAGGRVTILGMYTLDAPANAVCDPNAQDSRDGYAAGDWDAPCTATTSDVAVHVTLKWSHNRLWADFSPALRFVPSANVTLSTDLLAPIVRFYGRNDDGQIGDFSEGRSRKWGLAYASSIDGKPVNDAKNDPSLRSVVDFGSGRISRRIKHFSGYNIFTGLACVVDPNDPFCIEVEGGP